ncbi:MAG: hypothetical protein R3B91_20840 [Planctomycetaceae bacterium]
MCDAATRALITGLFLLGPHAYQRIRWQREIYPFWGLEIWWSWVPVGLLLLWIAQERGWLEAWDEDKIASNDIRIPTRRRRCLRAKPLTDVIAER